MDEMPVIPEDLGALDNEALAELAVNLRTWGREAAKDATPEVLPQLQEASTTLTSIKDMQAERVEAEAAFAADLATTSATFEDEPVKLEADAKTADKAAPKKAAAKKDEPKETVVEGDPAEPQVGHEVTDAAEENPAAPEGGPQFTAPNLVRMNDEAPPTPMPTRGIPVGALRASAGVSGHNVGEPFADPLALGTALIDRFKDIAGGGAEKLAVAKAFATFDETHTLTESTSENIAKFGGLDALSPEAVTAAICAPAQPVYELGCMSSTERPVRGSMAAYGMPRGAVTIYPNPKLADISGGTGVWTKANDADTNAVKTCSVIPCSTPVQYDIYGVYRCMTVTNLMQMTFAELVTAFLNRLAAVQARLAEKTLLNSMVNSVNTFNLTTTTANLGASTQMWRALIQSIAVYREQERFGDQPLHAWIPRWVCAALQIDLASRRITAGEFTANIVTEAQITAALGRLGVNVTWTLDDATTWTSVGAQADGAPATLVSLPTTAKFMLSPEGNFRVGDRGDLTIGVTNNNLYRDTTTNLKNQFTFFFENFETLIDFGCRSYEVAITNFNPTGIQQGDYSVGGVAPA